MSLQSAGWYDDYYKEHAKEYELPYEMSRYFTQWNLIIDSILPKVGNDPWILELGCGPGEFGEMLAAHGYHRYLGIDFSKEAMKIAKTKIPYTKLLCGDFMKFGGIEIPSCGVDVVICLETLEHLQDDQEVLRRLWPGLWFIGMVPSFDWISHVRYFKNKAEVEERYSQFLDECTVWTAGEYFIFFGTIKKEL
jgi:2-polyprenyl-3-methyl-5-hydroxy-6-metoxy-1,4-benzoquinol methylase